MWIWLVMRLGSLNSCNQVWWKKKGVVRWDLEGPKSSGHLAHCSHPFFMSICIEFSASYSVLSQSFVKVWWSPTTKSGWLSMRRRTFALSHTYCHPNTLWFIFWLILLHRLTHSYSLSCSYSHTYSYLLIFKLVLTLTHIITKLIRTLTIAFILRYIHTELLVATTSSGDTEFICR